MGFSRQEYWNRLPFPPPGDLPDSGTIHRDLPGDPDPGIEPASLKSPALAGEFFTTSNTWEAPMCIYIYIYVLCQVASGVSDSL